MDAGKPKHKKYILFQYDSYDAAGGINDISASFDTLEEAKSYVDGLAYDYNVVVDRDTWDTVWTKD